MEINGERCRLIVIMIIYILLMLLLLMKMTFSLLVIIMTYGDSNYTLIFIVHVSMCAAVLSPFIIVLELQHKIELNRINVANQVYTTAQNIYTLEPRYNAVFGIQVRVQHCK